MKQRIISLLLVLALLTGCLPAAMATAAGAVQWPGTGNFVDNNQVTDAPTAESAAGIEEKWAYALNQTVDSWGAYYAGQTVIAAGFLYATGGERLHRVDLETGEGTVSQAPAGSSGWVYDFLCWGDDTLFVATGTSLEAFDPDTLESLGSVEGTFGTYCPVQYHDGVLACGGWLYRYENGVFTPLGGPGDQETFNWSSGVFLEDYYYLAGQNTLYAVDTETGEVAEAFVFDPARKTNNQGGTVYDADTGRLYWATSYASQNLYSLAVNSDGTLDESSLQQVDIGQDTVSTPVLWNGRVYVAGQKGMVSVVDAETMTLLYTTDSVGSKIQGTPLLSTAGADETGKIHLYVQCYDAPGNLYVLEDGAGQTSGTLEQLTDVKSDSKYAYAYEQLAADAAGNLYFYNESGLLYCWGPRQTEVPVITEDLQGGTVRYEQGQNAEPLTVRAELATAYQWYCSQTASGVGSAVPDATQERFTPPTDEAGTRFYYCQVTGPDGSINSKTVCVVVTAAEAASGTIYVTLSASGEIVTGADRDATWLADAPVLVTDRNGDGMLNIDETLLALHEQYYADGAAGYEAVEGQWGLSIAKLWGDKSGSYGYYYNDQMAMGLTDPVTDGGRVKAWIYQDQTGYSDLYTWFDMPALETKPDKTVSLTLQASAWSDTEGAMITVPVSGAEICVLQTGQTDTTDESGLVQLKFEQAGTYTVLASSSETQSLVPSVCTVTVKEAGGSGGGTMTVSFTLLGDELHGEQTTVHTYEKGNLQTWIAKTTVTTDRGATAAEVIEQVLADQGYQAEGLEDGYITAVTTPKGKTLGELDNGEFSGWMFAVNGSHPEVSVTDYQLSAGDRLVLHYTDDYNQEEDGKGTGGSGSSSATSSTVRPSVPSGYADVAESDWYYDAVQTVTEKGWMQGVSEQKFAPGGTVTRAMAVQTLYRLAEGVTTQQTSTFSDVAADAWYADAVAWAVEQNIATGYDDGTFRPNAAVSRQQLATFLYRFTRQQEVAVTVMADLSGYQDAAAVAPYAQSAMRWCCAVGLLTGRSETELAPQAGTTRAELATILTRWPGEAMAEDNPVLQQTADALLAAVPDPRPGSTGGEWAVIGLARSGSAVDESWYDTYLTNLTEQVRAQQGVLSQNKYTEYARTALALLALGEDPTDVAGYDLLAPLQDYDATIRQGINGAIWALLAIRAAGEPADYTQVQAQYLAYLLDRQLPDGGFALSGQTADPDITAMALQALAGYRNERQVQTAVDRALQCLSKLQDADGGFTGWQTSSCESTAQVAIALAELGISLDDSRFVKNGNTVLDGLMQYAVADGGFAHQKGGKTDLMATEQALCALAAVQRLQTGQPSLYSME